MISNRISNLRQYLHQNRLEGLIVSKKENIFYFTGFTGSASLLMITNNEIVFITDPRYNLQSAEEVKITKPIITKQNFLKRLVQYITTNKLKKVGIESNVLTVDSYNKLKEYNSRVVYKPLLNVVEQLRMIKDADELELIKTSCKLCDRAFNHILIYLKPGVYEYEIALELEYFLRQHAGQSSKISFDFIVATGKRSAYIHGRASNKKIDYGDTVLLDFGIRKDMYHSDFSRTLFIGKVDKPVKKLYNSVKEANQQCRESVYTGMKISALENEARQIFKLYNCNKFFTHGLGHGVGLEIHELPKINIEVKNTLQKNMVFTIEPGLYIPDFAGIRIEDTGVLTETGFQSFTNANRDLLII